MIKRIVKRWSVLIIIIFAFFLLIRSCSSIPAIATAINVNAATAIQKDVDIEITTQGNVQAYTTVNVKSLVEGQLQAIHFKGGEVVHPQQLLFTIDARPFEIALAVAKANLARDKAQLNTALSSLKRQIPLRKKGFISQQDFAAIQNNAEALTATIHADEAAIAKAKLQLSYCNIKSPIEGRTGSVLVHAGNLVKANDTNSLVVINQLSPINVVFNLPENKLMQLKQDFLAQNTIPVSVISTNDNSIIEQGRLSFINNTVDVTTGTIQLKATFANTNYRLWPGEFVNVKLVLQKITHAILIPTVAVQMGPNGNFVYTIQADNVVKFTPVEIGPSIENNTVIVKGLSVGAKVVTSGLLRLTDNASVHVQDAS
jgi:membrane fusion protein, multidrug efflux system